MKTSRRAFRIGENTRMALETLRDHKVRSILTVLGVFIAVVVLIVVFSIMYGFDKDVRAYLEDYGPETLFIQKFNAGIHLGNLTPEERQRKPFVREDTNAVLEECPIRPQRLHRNSIMEFRGKRAGTAYCSCGNSRSVQHPLLGRDAFL